MISVKMWYSFWMANRWLCLNYDVLGAFAILMTTLFSINQLRDAGLAGICITSAMSYTNSSAFSHIQVWPPLIVTLSLLGLQVLDLYVFISQVIRGVVGLP